jgi:hypothetical protein
MNNAPKGEEKAKKIRASSHKQPQLRPFSPAHAQQAYAFLLEQCLRIAMGRYVKRRAASITPIHHRVATCAQDDGHQ